MSGLLRWMERRRLFDGHGEIGASLVEYALLVLLIAVVCVAAVGVLGGQTSVGLSSAGSGLAGG